MIHRSGAVAYWRRINDALVDELRSHRAKLMTSILVRCWGSEDALILKLFG